MLAGIGGLAAGAFLAGKAHAGPLTPPPGPIAPTPGPEPRIAINQQNTPGDATAMFRITLPGSYYMPGNITATSGRHGIAINTSNVAIDLMGYSLHGGGGTNARGIISLNTYNAIVVQNGLVAGWSGTGIDLSIASRSEVKNIIATQNGGHGIHVFNSSVVRSCTASLNVEIGIFAGNSSVVQGCMLTRNTRSGIGVAWDCVILDNICYENGRSHGSGGITVDGGYNRIENNQCMLNGRGIRVGGEYNLIIRNACSSNIVENWSIERFNYCQVVQALTSLPFIYGNSGGATIGSSNPYANFTF